MDYLFGLARNSRLEEAIRPELAQAKALSDQHQQPVRFFTDFRYRTLKNWSRLRRVVAKAEVLQIRRGTHRSTQALAKGDQTIP